MSPHPHLLAAAFDAVARHLNAGASDLPQLLCLAERLPQIEALLRAAANQAGLSVRRVRLRRKRWWSDAVAPIICFTRGSNKPLALLPTAQASFRLHDPETGQAHDLSERQARGLDEEAFMFYRSLPHCVRTCAQLMRYGRHLFWGQQLPTLVTSAIGGMLPSAFVIAALTHPGLQLSTALALALFSVAAAATDWSGWIFAVRTRGGLAVALEAALWQRILRLPVNFVRSIGAADLGEHAADLRGLSDKLAYEGAEFLKPAIGLAANLALLAWLNPALGLAATAIVALFVTGRVRRGKGAAVLAEDLRQMERRNLRLLHGIVTDLTQLRLAGAAGRASKVWEKAFAGQCQAASSLRQFRRLDLALEAGLLPLSWFLLLSLHAAGWLSIEAAQVPASIIALGLALGSAWGLSERWLDLRRNAGASKRLSVILEATVEADTQHAAEHVLRGAIAVEAAEFQYPGAAAPALKGISLRIEAGEFIGLAGASGSGKSTLIRLLLGFETARSGRILFDGVPSSDIRPAQLRGQIDAVLQDEALVPGTIRSNIVGTFDYRQEEAWAAARVAQLAEEIEAMPMGMQTFASAHVLSTSQQQRLLVARAVVRRPRILVLDEAMSALDEAMQSRLLGALRHWNAAGAGMTCLIVSHRPSLLAQMDRVFVFERGSLVETRSGCRGAATSKPVATPNADRNAIATPFRTEAVERLASPQAMDQMPRLIRAAPAWALLALAIAAAGTGICLFGR
jgi:ABC-type bacteriocin/lantibiotic exporter with double-glycine peptidase domain